MSRTRPNFKFLIAVGLSVAICGCVNQFFLGRPIYDGKKVTIQTLSLFNQRAAPKHGPLWQGDWIFRRERLEAIDHTLRAAKPDILVFRELIAKQGSPYDSDQFILGAGSLQGYEWQQLQTKEYRDTHEVESIAVVTGLPVHKDPDEAERKKMWMIGDQSYLAAFIIHIEEENIAVFNLKIDEVAAAQGIWYDYAKSRIQEFLQQYKICHKRVIVAGEFENSLTQNDYERLMSELGLIDSSIGFCEKEDLCYTATPQNTLFQLSRGDILPKRSTRILSHRSALVYTSLRNFDTSIKNSSFLKAYDQEQLSATQTYGWITSLRLARCRN